MAYEKAQERILALPDNQTRNDVLAQNTLIFLTKVESAR